MLDNNIDGFKNVIAMHYLCCEVLCIQNVAIIYYERNTAA